MGVGKINNIEQKKPVLKLIGTDGNAFSLLGKAKVVAKKNNMNWEEISKEAMNGDYNHLLQTLMKYFEVE